MVIDGNVVEPGHLSCLGTGRDELGLTVEQPARVLLIGGVPCDEHVLMWWNFVARTPDEILAAHADRTAGAERFGRVDSALARIEVALPPARRWACRRSARLHRPRRRALSSVVDQPPGGEAPTVRGGAGDGRALPHPPLIRQPGYLRRIFRQPQPVLDELREVYGPIVGLGAGPVRMAIVGEPGALHELFRMPTEAFRWGHKFNVLGFVVGDRSMIVSDGEAHHRRRSSVQSAFSRRRLNRWIPMIVESTDEALDRLVTTLDGGTRHVDLYVVGRRLVLGIVVRALFGERMAARVDEIGELFQCPQDYLEAPAIRQLPHRLPFTTRARVRADRKALDEIIDAEIAHRRAHPAGDPLDVLEALVTEGAITDAEIRDQVVTLIGAGYDTTSATLAWMLWCSALRPGLWDRLRAEADAVYGPVGSGRAADDATLAALDLAGRVMREATRLHPAGVIAPREAAADVVVGGYRIRKGTLILWSAHLAGRDPAAWSDPLTFDPDRFVDMSPEQSALADLAWVPFGRGARNCIGFALAQMELTLIIARFAQRLDVQPIGTKPRPVGMVVNRPSGGAPMAVTARHHPN